MQLHFCYPVSIKFPFITIKWDVKPLWMTQAETNNKFICDCVSISLSTSKCIETSIHLPSNERCHIVFRVKTTEIYCLNRFFPLNCGWFNGNIFGSFYISSIISHCHWKLPINNTKYEVTAQFDTIQTSSGRESISVNNLDALKFKPWIYLHVIIRVFEEKLSSA